MLLFTDSFAIVGLCYIKFGRLRTFFKVEFKTDINYSYSHKQLSVIIIVSRKVFRYICKKRYFQKHVKYRIYWLYKVFQNVDRMPD